MSRGLYTRFCAEVLFPLHERFKGHDTARVRRELEVTQWWDPERLAALRLERLKSLLGQAAASVPFYRDLFRSLAFDPRDVRTEKDIAALPLLTKDTIRANDERLKSENAIDLKRFSTTGSSGDPLQFCIGSARVTHDVAAKWRATRWWDVDIGDREVVAWSSPIELSAQDRLRMMRDKLLRTHLLPTIALSDSTMDKAVDRIRSIRPTMLFGYPSSIATIAEHAERKGLRMDDLGIKVAFVTAEKTHPHQREQISRTFGCRVADGYGGRDAGFIAHECPEGGLHITAEDVIVEVLDPHGRSLPPGVVGEIVVTHLHTADYPFIRYPNGDLGALDDRRCSCGRGLPLIKEIQGRTNDFLLAADGTKVHDVAFAMVLRETPGVRAFKIIQETMDLTRVLLAVNAQYREASDDRVRNVVHHRLGDGVQVAIEKVEDIPAEPTGKYRYVVSRIGSGGLASSPSSLH